MVEVLAGRAARRYVKDGPRHRVSQRTRRRNPARRWHRDQDAARRPRRRQRRTQRFLLRRSRSLLATRQAHARHQRPLRGRSDGRRLSRPLFRSRRTPVFLLGILGRLRDRAWPNRRKPGSHQRRCSDHLRRPDSDARARAPGWRSRLRRRRLANVVFDIALAGSRLRP